MLTVIIYIRLIAILRGINLLLIVALSMRLPTCTQATPYLTVLTLNCSKLSATQPSILQRLIELIGVICPSIFVLTEFSILDGVPSACRAKLGSLYKFLHTPPSPLTTQPGILAGVTQNIPSALGNFQISDKYKHSVLLFTIGLPEIAGSQNLTETTHSMHLCTASKNSENDQAHFWEEVSKVVDNRVRWMVTGDMNTALSADKHSDGHYLRVFVNRDSRNPYRPFLTKHSGTNLWQIKGRRHQSNGRLHKKVQYEK